jgi:CHRD domain-containing protein
MRTSVLSTALVVAFVGIACSDDTTAPANNFHSNLTNAQEVPATAAPSSARAHAVLVITATTIQYTVTIDALPGTAITAAHIHAGTAAGGGTNAGTGNGVVRINLCGAGATAPGNQACPTTVGGAMTGTWTYAATDTLLNSGTGTGIQSRMTWESMIATLRGFGAYVNIHTTANGGGEIRGQVIPNAP